MSKKNIYGLDSSQPYNSTDVRNAIINCFVRAHKRELDKMKEYGDGISDEEFEKMKSIDVIILVKRFFKEIGGDYENPTKESIRKVCDKLAEFASNFRSQDEIKKHYGEIMGLINELPDKKNAQ